jgi:hypothetical protein
VNLRGVEGLNFDLRSRSNSTTPARNSENHWDNNTDFQDDGEEQSF